MEAPSMVQRSGDQLIVRSVVSGDQLYCDPSTILSNIAGNINKLTKKENSVDLTDNFEDQDIGVPGNKDEGLPQCKIKRNYSCNNCTYFTQNPRHYLTHLRDIHGERIVINECKLCLYASRHYQKLVRHMKMVHGSTEGIDEPAQSRKRASQLIKKTKRRKIDNNNDMLQQIQNYIPLELKMDRVLDTPEKMMTACAQLQEHSDEMLMQKGDGAKSFKCTKCTYETHIKARYSKHVKYHTMPMIKCIMCDFRTPYKWNLDRHMKNHGGTGHFKCSACNFTAEIKQSLTVHETNHHVPPVGHASGMNLSKRRNKVGGTDIPDEFITDGILLQQEKYANMKEMSWPESMLSNSSFNNNNNNSSFNENRNSILNYTLIKSEGESSSPELNSQRSSPPRKASRPVPNLIPILQNNPVNLQQTALNLSMTPNRSSDSSTSTMTQRDFREICSKSTNSSLKDFASLFGSEEFLAGDYDRIAMPQLSPSSNILFKKKNASFFDKLKEKLISGTGDGSNLVCQCGHTAKCLSESVIHQKSCSVYRSEMNQLSSSPVPTLGSTRCQHCRHRCKSSADLISHLSTCAEAQMNADSFESSSDNGSGDRLEIADESMDESPVDNPNENEPHPMENVVFVWNKMPEGGDQDKDQDIKKECTTDDEANNTSTESLQAENSFYGIETAPGYGEVTKEISPGEETPTAALKKVFKCPHCSFWASTASRFHVHIVGHLNKKPFECSLCSYRSNWRWDITKHIRLKTIRDPNHESARVLMNDETGRRNYTKYNKYMTLMKVTDDNNKSMKSGDITHNQDLIVCNTSTSSNKSGKNGENGTTPQPEGNSVSPREVPLQLPLLNTNIYDLTTLKLSGGESSGVSVTKSDNDKKTSFKCKKCNYMHPDRNVVLLHVKEHYREAGITINTQKVASPIPVSNTSSPQPASEQFLKSNNLIMNGLLEIMYPSIVGSVKQQQQQQQPNTTNISTNTSSSSMLNHPNNDTSMMMMATEHGEMEEASSGGTSVSEWRPAPYRCGHCHQVSNWKHVIQRHCRLKHNGDIKIELMDKDPNSRPATVTIPIPTTIATSTPIATIIQPKNYQTIISTNQQTILNEIPISVNEKSNEEELTIIPLTIPSQPIPSSSNYQTIKKLKKYQCDLCPYITDNKYQHTYHKSFHSPREETFQCTFCTYNVSKRHLLNQHMRMHSNEVVNVKQEIVEGTTTIPVEYNAVDLRVPYGKGNSLNEKKIIYCSKCPGRFLAEKDIKLHLKMHTATFPYKCTLCSYTARQQSYLESHITVHSLDYQEKTKELEEKFKICSHYVKPILKAITQDGIEVWIVSNITQKTTQDHFDLDEVIVSSKVPNNSFNQIDLDDEDEEPIIIDNQLKEICNINEETADVSEKCPHCPFATTTHSTESLKTHLQNHKCVSGKENSVKCDHCDYSVLDENILQDHIKLHFISIKNRKNVAFVTSYKNLELHKIDLINSNNNNNNIVNKNGKMSGSSRLVFKDPKQDGVIPIDDIFNSHSISDEKTYFIDISTGKIIGDN